LIQILERDREREGGREREIELIWDTEKKHFYCTQKNKLDERKQSKRRQKQRRRERGWVEKERERRGSERDTHLSHSLTLSDIHAWFHSPNSFGFRPT